VPDLPRAPERVTLVVDGTCGFCTRTVRLVRALDRRRRVTAVPFQKPGVPEANGLTFADCERAAWAVTPDARGYPGAAGINVALSTMLGARLPWLVYRLPGVRQAQDWLYSWIADHRHRFPGDVPYCEQHPAECR
jgi:predicted DCC family thiol-disulfide oxidoreductase YuxK